MAISARVISRRVTAGSTFIEMTAERCCTASLDSSEHFQMKAIEPVSVVPSIWL